MFWYIFRVFYRRLSTPTEELFWWSAKLSEETNYFSFMAWLCKNEACTIKRSNDICLTEYLLNKRFLDEVCLRDKWQIRPELIARFQYHDAISSISTPRRWDASPSQGYPQHYIRRYLFIHLEGDTHCVRVKFLAEEHNTMSPAPESSALTMEPPRWPKKQSWSMDVYSFFLGWAQITEMCLKKVKWIAVSYWKTPTGVDFLQHLFPGKFISSLQLSRVLDFDSVTF